MIRKQLPYQNTYRFLGATLSFETMGKGKPIILLHGALTHWPAQTFKQRLAKHYQVYVPDMPGFGASDTVKNKLHNTNLFTQAFARFLKKTKLKSAPIVALSLGTIVAVKAACKNKTSGKLILVGMPGKINGWRFLLANLFPLWLKRLIININWEKKNFLIPLFRNNVGNGKNADANFLKLLNCVDAKAIVDIDYKKEIEVDLPLALKKTTNKVFFIYGSRDKQKNTTKHLVKNPIIIPRASHNIFRCQPEKSLQIIKNCI